MRIGATAAILVRSHIVILQNVYMVCDKKINCNYKSEIRFFNSGLCFDLRLSKDIPKNKIYRVFKLEFKIMSFE